MAQFYTYNRFTTEQGLSQMQVHALYKDGHGYLWVGTKDGINRFDGQRFTSFRQKIKLTHPQIINICGDSKGRIFFNTQKDLGYLLNDSFHRMQLPGQLAHAGGVLLFCDRKDRIWLHNSNIIYRINTHTGKTDSLLLSHQFSYTRIHTQFVAVNDDLWGVHEGKLIRLQTETMRMDTIAYVNHDIQHICHSPALNKLFLANHTAVYSFDLGSNSHDLIYNDPKKHIQQLAIDNLGKLFVYTKSHHFIYLDGSPSYFPNGIKSIDLLLIDTTEHLIIAGTESGLVLVYQNGMLRYEPKESAMPEDVWNIYEDKSGRLFFHSYTGGISALEQHQLKDVSHNYTKELLEHVHYQSVKVQNGDVYLSYMNGLVKNNGHSLTFCTPFKKYHPICLLYDSLSNTLLFGDHDAVMQYHPGDHSIDTVVQVPIQRYVLSITRINSQWLLFTSGLGYYLYNTRQKKLSTFHYANGQSPFRGAACSFRDSSGRIWVGSRDGLYRFDTSSFKMIPIPGVPQEPISAMIQSDRRHLLLGAGSGLLLANIPSLLQQKPDAIYRFNRWNGFNGIECRQNGFFKDSKNRIWIPTSTNVMCLLPEQLFADTASKHTMIESVYCGAEIDQWIRLSSIQDIEMKYPVRNIKIEFRAGALLNTDKVRFQYRLHAHQPWSHWTTESSVRFYDLPPGHYQFQVRSEHQGKMETSQAEISFTLRPRWFEIFSVRIILLIAVIALMISLWIMLQTRKKNRELNIREERAALELEILKQQMNPHFLRNTLKSFQLKILNMDEKSRFEVADDVSALSRLFSLYLDASVKKFITIDDEIKLLQHYLEFQVMRFKHKFSYAITKDPGLDGQIKLTPMIIQPFVENASEKAFAGLDRKGDILISFLDFDQNTFCVEVKDNGIGRKKANEMKGNHISYSGQIIDKMRALYALGNRKTNALTRQQPFHYTITDLYNEHQEGTGTIVHIYFPKQQL